MNSCWANTNTKLGWRQHSLVPENQVNTMRLLAIYVFYVFWYYVCGYVPDNFLARSCHHATRGSSCVCTQKQISPTCCFWPWNAVYALFCYLWTTVICSPCFPSSVFTTLCTGTRFPVPVATKQTHSTTLPLPCLAGVKQSWRTLHLFHQTKAAPMWPSGSGLASSHQRTGVYKAFEILLVWPRFVSNRICFLVLCRDAAYSSSTHCETL